MTEDELNFAEESVSEPRKPKPREWLVLIVDDERDVHESTVLALGREKVCGRELRFFHAYSSTEAREILSAKRDFAIILLDVVMENEHAGLDLVKHIRDDLKILDSRIILRTGQPGYAPELDTITRYEINDYKSKSELTRNKLFTTLTAAIRSYAQVRALELSKRGLETIIKASKELLYLRGYQEFASGVITQIAALLHLPEEGLVLVKRLEALDDSAAGLQIIAAAGRYSHLIMKPLSTLKDELSIAALEQAAEQKQNILLDEETCLYFDTPDGTEMIVYLAAGIEKSREEMQLIELFSTNIAACIDNITLLEQRHEYAYQDQLLGIPNRLSFLQAIDHHLQCHSPSLQIVLIDIDQFGALNDTIGTENGDLLLQEISYRLRNKHPHQLVARISGDTFALLGPCQTLSPEKVKAVFSKPFEISGTSHTLSATQGRVVLDNQKSATEVLAQANVALKRAKQTLRGGFQDFHTDMLKETESRVHLLQNLRQAFDQERLFMAYQPKIELATGKLIGFEALMRWKADTGGYVAPLEFIPIAETSGLIVPLGEWALRASLVKIRQMRKRFGSDLTMAVNVSMVQFAQPEFLSMVDAALAFAEAEPESLELEITESFAMHDFETVCELINDIHARGIRIAIDDFGTGFSSLSYLEKLRVHSLKIDKTFVDRINENDLDTRIPETILRLGHSLGLSVVAEGIETQFQADWLKSNQCDFGQGYLFAKPLSAVELEQWTRSYASD
ncbi:MAG: hypothetical protein C9356_04050 [Oleiphilus sp.]|nr:MAG: hypothetical protein C9356_04050 [Oleiphilus sp.]